MKKIPNEKKFSDMDATSNRMLFVLTVPVRHHAGGIERVTWLLANGLRAKGFSITFLSLGKEKESTESDSPFKQYFLPVTGMTAAGISSGLKQVLESEKIDTVILQGIYSETDALLPYIPESLRVFAVHHNQPFAMAGKERIVKKLAPWKGMGLKDRFMKAFGIVAPSFFKKFKNKQISDQFQRFIQSSDKLILLSDRFTPRLLSNLRGPVDESKIISINNPNTFSLSSKDEDYQKKNIVLVVGRLTNPQKNITGFIDVWKKLSPMAPDWKAVVVGDGQHADYIKEYARKKRVGNLDFVGNKKNVQDYYKEAKIFCMTSTYEGWPMVLAEAMACRCVPIAYDSFEAIHDIIIPRCNGLLVPPFRKNDMVKAILTLAFDEPLREEMARRGVETIKEFEIDKIVEKWEELLRK